MRTHYCKRQTQTAKAVVLGSGIVLLVMWVSYFKYPNLFSKPNADLHIMPNQHTDIVDAVLDEDLVKLKAEPSSSQIEDDEDSQDSDIGVRYTAGASIYTASPVESYTREKAHDAVSEQIVQADTQSHRSEKQVNESATNNEDRDTETFPVHMERPTTQIYQNVGKDREGVVLNQVDSKSSAEVELKATHETKAVEEHSDIVSGITNYNISSDQKAILVSHPSTEEPNIDNNSNSVDYTKMLMDQEELSSDVNKNESESTDNRVTVAGVGHVESVNDSDVVKLSPYIDVHLRFKEKETRYTVLLWNEPVWMKDADIEVDMAECTYTNCRLTSNREMFQTSSAVVFSVRDKELRREPPVKPEDRAPNQVWVIHNMDIPVELEIHNHWENSFNWSWSYRPDADIYNPYGTMITRKEQQEKDYKSTFQRKTKFAAWFSTDCEIQIWVKEYLTRLNAIVPIDIYSSCDRNVSDTFDNLISKDYKFYLGFEDFFCDDFITDQFFHYMTLDVVNVVIGMGKYEYLPGGSFINAGDFNSIETLGEYLRNLATNEDEYVSYLKNKDLYDVRGMVFMYRNALCNLCERLNNLDEYGKTYSKSDLIGSFGRCENVPDFQ